MSKARFGSFNELLEFTEERLRPIAKAVRDTVFEIDSNTIEVVRLGDRATTYGLGPRKMIDGYAFI